MPEDLVTICDKCLSVACWQGEFMCDDAQGAGAYVDLPISVVRSLEELAADREAAYDRGADAVAGAARQQIAALQAALIEATIQRDELLAEVEALRGWPAPPPTQERGGPLNSRHPPDSRCA